MWTPEFIKNKNNTKRNKYLRKYLINNLDELRHMNNQTRAF